MVDDVARDAALRRLDRLAYWLDDRFRIPGTKLRLGLDGVVGLIPGVGDGAMALLSAYIIAEAWGLGAPPSVIVRMLANFGVDLGLGVVPVVGDVIDIGWKANRRNIDLLRRHLRGMDERTVETAGGWSPGSDRG